jgi:hypothetical protein
VSYVVKSPSRVELEYFLSILRVNDVELT